MGTTRRELLTGGPLPTLVVVFLRGAADGLNLVVPHGERDYYALRPTLAVPRPGEEGGALDLDGHFGLHPRLAPLMGAWEAGELGIVHATGSDDTTRSHFEAQDRMEHGHASLGTGWLGRHLRTRPGPAPTGLTAVHIGPKLPESLRAAPGAAALTDLSAYTVPDGLADFRTALDGLYAGTSALHAAGRDTLTTLDRLASIEPSPSEYPDTAFARGLREVASLIRADVGLEVATLDLGNWDTHFVQDTLFGGLCDTLAGGLSAFRADLDARMERVTVVVMTEFGRRVYENASLGTDHGRGSALFAMGGAVRGGIHGEWPGLQRDEALDAHDLPVVTDFRDILWEVAAAHGHPDPHAVFPDWRPRPIGLIRG